jgi:hypothetical protein
MNPLRELAARLGYTGHRPAHRLNRKRLVPAHRVIRLRLPDVPVTRQAARHGWETPLPAPVITTDAWWRGGGA